MYTRKIIRSTAAFVFLSLLAASAQAQSWSDQLFDKRSHDFGWVARGKLKTTFTITNNLKQPVHIMSATPSCSVCTVARPEKEWLDPGESTTLDATLDAHKFQLRKEVAIDVRFDKPQYGVTRLNLVAHARTDIVLSPGEFSFGTVKRGTGSTATMRIEYAGDPKWQISSATCTNSAFGEPVLEEVQRSGGRVTYLLKLSLKDEASPGTIRDRVVLGINDAYNKSLDIGVQAFVQADVSISPATLSIGSVPANSTMTKQVLVRGIKPFRIVEIESDEGPFQIEKPEDSKLLHKLEVTLKSGHDAGDVTQQFLITTDMAGEKPLKLTVSAKLVDTAAAVQTTSK